MESYEQNKQVLKDLISKTEKNINNPKRVSKSSYQTDNYLYVVDMFGKLSFHIQDLAKEYELSNDDLRAESNQLRLDILKLFNQYYSKDCDDEDVLTAIDTQLVGNYFKDIDAKAKTSNQLNARQITYTYILTVLSEIYLFFEDKNLFMSYILSANNALGVIVANHSYVPYEQLSSHYRTIGSKGGSKGVTDAKFLKSIYEYHDEFFSEKKPNGKYKYFATEVVDSIVEKFGMDLPYDYETIAKYIRTHRRNSTKN